MGVNIQSNAKWNAVFKIHLLRAVVPAHDAVPIPGLTPTAADSRRSLSEGQALEGGRCPLYPGSPWSFLCAAWALAFVFMLSPIVVLKAGASYCDFLRGGGV